MKNHILLTLTLVQRLSPLSSLVMCDGDYLIACNNEHGLDDDNFSDDSFSTNSYSSVELADFSSSSDLVVVIFALC
jgi:hypothetical protein